MNSTSRILVLGFYNRSNIGDDFYQYTLTKLFGNVTFKSIDDLTPLDILPPEPPDIIIVGGGDIINRYFMTKVESALKNYPGRIYAFSVGIPYPSEGIKYLNIFDHMFLRSRVDYELAASIIGKENATYLPDASTLYSRELLHNCWRKPLSQNKIGLCLAQPLFCDNAMGDIILHSICRSIIELAHTSLLQIHLFAFNYSNNNERESDLIVNEKIASILKAYSISCTNHTDITTSQNMLQALDKMNLIIGSRYHSIMFSVILKKKFIPIYVSQKIDNLLKDLNFPAHLSIKLPTDALYKPTYLDTMQLTSAIKQAVETSYEDIWHALFIPNYKPIVSAMLRKKKTKCVKVCPTNTQITPNDFESILKQTKNLLQLPFNTPYLNPSIREKGFPPTPIPQQTPMDIARIISYIITGSIQSPYIWGLAENLTRPDFCLFEALDYIWKDSQPHAHTHGPAPTSPPSELYYPPVKNLDRTGFVTVDSFLKTNYSEYHRSGWAYAVGGLMNISAPSFSRSPTLLVDTYTDRTFHWGLSTMTALNALPYKTPWIGFIHHTFDTTHSSYNCTQLFKNPMFIESLKSCKGLISLTEYLAVHLRRALMNLPSTSPPLPPPVYVIPHPMEFVSELFSMQNFLKNPNKKIIQIGAWLRNPFAIYALPIPTSFPIHKAVLRGKEMDQYFKPPDLFNNLETILLHCGATTSHERTCCEDVPCRPSQDQNKYCKGLYQHIIDCDSSVTIIEKLSNKEYDKLLSENIAFLNLIDCSAVNTVLECLVRNTPLIVNRHPAIEEIYGPKYPGFYNSLLEAANIAMNPSTLASITNYLKSLNKSKYELSYFVQKVSDILSVQ